MLDFGQRIVPFDKTKMVPYHEEIMLTNKDTKPIDWQVGEIVMEGNSVEGVTIFSISPLKGQLLEGEHTNIHVEFLPENPSEFKAHVPMYLDHDLENEYMQLGLKGCGAYPKLTFDCKEVVLPIVPLNTKSVAQFHIINNGYDSLELKYKILLDQSKLPITLIFPSGKSVNNSAKRIPVIVTFTSSKSISFTTRIDFYDSQNNRYGINITGTSDNCILTNYPYLLSHNKTHRLYAPDKKAVNFYEFNHIKYLTSNKPGYKPPESRKSSIDIDLTPPNPIPSANNISFLLSFISQTISTDVINSLEQLKVDDGILLYKLLSLLTNKHVPGMPKVWPTKPELKIEKKIEMYNEMLIFLKGHGALLNTVDPKGLLTSDEYLTIKVQEFVKSQDKNPFDNVIKDYQNKCLEEYHNYSISCWTTLLYQIIRILVLFRVSPINFFNCPGITEGNGVQKPQIDSTVTGSDIFGISENLLLKWLTYHHHKMHGAYLKRVTNFTDNLTNGVILIHLVLSHVPEMGNDAMPLSHYDEVYFIFIIYRHHQMMKQNVLI